MGLFHPSSVWLRGIRATACLGWIAAIVLLFLVTVGVAREARAGCNLIPVAAEELPSTGVVGDVAAVNDGAVVNGFVTRPIAGPGQTVTLGVDVDCDPGAAGFALPADPNPNVVKLKFRPPDGSGGEGPVTEWIVSPSLVRLKEESCDATRCSVLQFDMPDTSAVVNGGLTGPAEILVARIMPPAISPEVVARVFELFEPTQSCQTTTWASNTVFGKFTVLPAANVLEEGTVADLEGAVDGMGNLVMPLNFRNILDAVGVFPGEETLAILQAFSFNAQIINALRDPTSGTEDLRSFNVFGRPIPPLLRLVKNPIADPGFVGTTDVIESVLQVAPLLVLNYPNLMRNGIGPAELFGADILVQSAAPLESFRTSLLTVAAGADEQKVGDRDDDLDASHLVVEITDIDTGVVTNTGQGLELAGSSAAEAALMVEGDLVAFLEAEALPIPIDHNADGDFSDDIVRLYRTTGTGAGAMELTDPLIVTAQAEPKVDGRPLAISTDVGPGEADYVFFVTREADEFPETTEVVWETAAFGMGIPWTTETSFKFRAAFHLQSGLEEAGVDYGHLNPGFANFVAEVTGVDPMGDLTGTFTGELCARHPSGGDCLPTDDLIVTVDAGDPGTFTRPVPITDASILTISAPITIVNVNPPLPAGLVNPRLEIVAEVDDGSISPGCCGDVDFDASGTITFLADTSTAVSLNGDEDAGDTVFQVLDAGAGTLSVNANVAASEVAVSAGVALVLVPEADEGNANRNSLSQTALSAPLLEDSDTTDLVALLYDALTDLPVNLGVAVEPGLAAISSELVCLGVSEAGQGGSDLTGDGDTTDRSLAVGLVDSLLSSGSLDNVGVAVEAVSALGTKCVFLRPEAAEPGSGPRCTSLPDGSCDLNGDGDALDLVLHVYDYTTGILTNVGWAAEDFVTAEGVDLVAFRTCEADHGTAPGTQLNGDQDFADCVMQAIDVGTLPPPPSAVPVVNTERQAIPCTAAICEAFDLYAVRPDGTVSFIGEEGLPGGPGQAAPAASPLPPGCLVTSPPDACDLDADGLGLSTVVHIVRIEDGAVTASQVAPGFLAGDEVKLSLPTTVVDQTVVKVRMTECRAASLCNACPELQGVVFGATLPYELGSCPEQFDFDPLDLPGELDCLTLRTHIVTDSDGDGVLDFGCTINDVCRELFDPFQDDEDGDSQGGACDRDDTAEPCLAVEMFCTVGTGSTGDDCQGKVVEAIFEYTGDGCAATTNPQEGKSACSGNEVIGSPVDLVYTGKDPEKVVVTPDTDIELGDSVSFTNVDGELKASTKFDVVGPDGTQSLEVHTSCSNSLNVGDQFGSMKLVELTTTEGGTVGAPVTGEECDAESGQQVAYTYRIQHSTAGEIVVDLEDDQLGLIAGNLAIPELEAVEVEATTTLSSTTRSTALATDQGQTIQCLPATDSVLVRLPRRGGCGIGLELVLLLPFLSCLHRRRRGTST